MDREQPTIHPDGEHVPKRDVLRALPGRHALRVLGQREDQAKGVDKASPVVRKPRQPSYDRIPTYDDPAIDHDRTRETLRIYREAFGVPAEIPDLSVDEVSARRLERSNFAGVIIIIPEPSTPALLPGLEDAIAAKLEGRDATVRVDDEGIELTFQMEENSYDSRMLVGHFCFKLALLVGGLPEWVSVGRYRGDFDDTRPRLKGVPFDREI